MSSTAAIINDVQAESPVTEVSVDNRSYAESIPTNTESTTSNIALPHASGGAIPWLPSKKLLKSETTSPMGTTSNVISVQTIIPHPMAHLVDEKQVSHYSAELRK